MATCFNGGSSSMFDFVVCEGNGVKGLADSGISEVPEQYVQPPDERIDKSNSIPHCRPPIDLSALDGPCHNHVVEAITTAAETLGFFQVVNHGVPLELLDSLKEAAHRFFGLPPKEKAVYRKGVSPSPLVTYNTSFVPENDKVLEWKDYVRMVYTSDDDAIQHWPKECKEVVLEYVKTSNEMVKKIIEVLIGRLDVDEPSKVIDSLIGQKTVSMNIYPRCPNPELTVGVGRHSDIGTLTVLLQDDTGGLYVKNDKKRGLALQTEWVEIPPISGALVINVGDTLQIISNGRYNSAEHRVRTSRTRSRVSIPLFIAPRVTQMIGPLLELVKRDGKACYKEVMFQDYMNNFFGKPYDGKKHILSFIKN